MRLIDADALLEAVVKNIVGKMQVSANYQDIKYLITNAPTIQREGWISVEEDRLPENELFTTPQISQEQSEPVGFVRADYEYPFKYIDMVADWSQKLSVGDKLFTTPQIIKDSEPVAYRYEVLSKSGAKSVHISENADMECRLFHELVHSIKRTELYTTPQRPQPLKRLSYDQVEALYDGGSWHDFANAIMDKMQELNK